MPTDEAWHEQAVECKRRGNDAFAAGRWRDAGAAYGAGIAACDRCVVASNNSGDVLATKAALLGNRALCYLKQLQLQLCIDDCTAALELPNGVDRKLRGKLLFRRGKARFLLHTAQNAAVNVNNGDNTANNSSNNNNTDQQLLLQEAGRDLLLLLNQIDPHNREAQQLLAAVRGRHKLVGSAAAAAAATPVSQTVLKLQQAALNSDAAEQLQQVKLLLGLLDNDLPGASRELGRCCSGEAVHLLINTARTTKDRKLAVLSMQCLSTAAGNPAFGRDCLVAQQHNLQQVLQTVAAADNNQNNPADDLLVTALAVWTRIILHADRDDPAAAEDEVSSATKLDDKAIVDSLVCALHYCQHSNSNNNSNNNNNSSSSVIRAVLDVLGTWTAGTEREFAIRSALANSNNLQDPLLPAPKTPQEVRNFTPQQLAAYKKRQSALKRRDREWARVRAQSFIETGAFQTLLETATSTPDHAVRREVAVSVGRLLSALDDDDAEHKQLKSILRPFLQSEKEEDQGGGGRHQDEPMIEEVYNEDGDNENDDETKEEEMVDNSTATSLETKMERALITAALLLSNKDAGAWALQFGWRQSDAELPDLIRASSSNARAVIAQCLASEVLSAAAGVPATRPLVASLIDSGAVETLMKSDDPDVRSGAASAVAKLGLSSERGQSSDDDEGEVMGLLLAACELLEQNDNDNIANGENGQSNNNKNTKGSKQSSNFSSFATSTVERAIEMITYLISNTTVKEELAAGFGAGHAGNKSAAHSALERLVQTADLPGSGESLSGFGLATIFNHLAVTNEQMRREAFAGKEVTMEQYDEMQRMGKTEEEKELLDAQRDPDTKELCGERIRKMASANVPRALVALTEGASEHTLEQIALAVNRMADEVPVRGILIQQGVLSACIKMEKKEGPTETDTMKKVIRLARHGIAKMLITTNPSLLTSAQRLGSIKPLIELIRDIHASELQHFEALLSVTNLAGSGEDAKNRVVTEKGIPTFHYAMFSDHEMVRTAATEAMCNLVPHPKMMEHLANLENLRLWMAFCVDWEDNYECARAAAGTLAMATQDVAIAQEMVQLAKFQEQMTILLECGRLEIMHRAFVILLNLVSHGSETRQKAIDAGLVTFCRAYIELQNHSKDDDDDDAHDAQLEFTAQEQQILPITVDMAKKIVKAADE